MEYRKEHNLTRDEIQALSKVMGTMQELIVLKTILDHKEEFQTDNEADFDMPLTRDQALEAIGIRTPLTREQIIETIQDNGGEAEFWCVHFYGKTIERLGYEAGRIYYLEGHKSEIDTSQHLIFYV
jgi:hypothetical protein